jgi:hypothetical protein
VVAVSLSRVSGRDKGLLSMLDPYVYMLISMDLCVVCMRTCVCVGMCMCVCVRERERERERIRTQPDLTCISTMLLSHQSPSCLALHVSACSSVDLL